MMRVKTSVKTGFFILLMLTGVRVFAQHSDAMPASKQLRLYEDSLKNLGKTLINNENDVERKNANYRFIKTLVSALKVSGSYNYSFDSVKAFSILKSPDNKFRIFSWHVMNEDGSYRFYGSIQLNSPQLKLFPLEDYTAFVKNPADTVTSNRKWFGAQYYTIIPVYDRKPYYLLLGWKGNNIKSTKKVIEVLSFNAENTPVFGADVFAGGEMGGKKRIVFEYTRNASMMMRYVSAKNMIVFDHLAASDAKMKGKNEFYGPDMSYDGLQLKAGKWAYVSDLNLQNIPTGKEDLYNDPRKMKDAIPAKTEGG